MALPPPPSDEPQVSAPVVLRFEDVTQDGRLVLEALPNALSPSLWRSIAAGSRGAQAVRAQGIVPILTRLRLMGTAGPFSTHSGVEAQGTFRLARAEDGRFMIDMWADLHAPVGRGHDDEGKPGAGRALAGRVHAENVLTRPFGHAGHRRVTSLDFPGAPEVTQSRPALPPFESIAALPEGATPLEPAMRIDPVDLAFGLMHTDRNRHVNSLVYLRVFEEAALRRFARLGLGSSFLARTVDIAYRKPCFAGQTMRVVAQAFESGGTLGVVAVLVTEAEAAQLDSPAPVRPHTFVRMTFEP